MKQPKRRPAYVVGYLSEYLGITAGKTNGLPVGILTFRSRSELSQSLNVMVSKAHLERLREDIGFLLANSEVLKTGEPHQIPLAEIEGIHDRLG